MIRLKQFSLGERHSEAGFRMPVIRHTGTNGHAGGGGGHWGRLVQRACGQPGEESKGDVLILRNPNTQWILHLQQEPMCAPGCVVPGQISESLLLPAGICQENVYLMNICLLHLSKSSTFLKQDAESRSATPRSDKHNLLLPTHRRPGLHDQTSLNSWHGHPNHRLAEISMFSAPETELVWSSSPVGRLSLNMSFSWLEIFSFLSVLIHGPCRPISSCANAII